MKSHKSNTRSVNLLHTQVGEILISKMAELKCVIVGDGEVGKTSLLMSYTTDTFQEDHIATVFDTYTMSVNVGKSQVFVR